MYWNENRKEFGKIHQLIIPRKKADMFSKDEFMLIELVERRPIFWDFTSELYKRVDLKNAV